MNPADSTLQKFKNSLIEMYQDAEAPDQNMFFEFTPKTDRYIGPGPEAYFYSVRLLSNETPAIHKKILQEEIELAQSRGRERFELKTFELLNGHEIETLMIELGFKNNRHSTLMYIESAAQLEKAPEVEVTHVQTDEQFEILVELNAAAFGKRADVFLRELRAQMHKTDIVSVYYSSVGGIPACAAWVKIFKNVAYMFGGGTIPELRGLGAYKTLVAERAEFSHKHKAEFMMSECSPDSEKVLRGLKFKDAGRLSTWTYEL